MVTIALDIGSTAVKAGLLNAQDGFAQVLSHPAPPVSGSNGIYETDALTYLKTATGLLKQCISQAGHTARLGLSCQRSSFLLWDKATGIPVTPLISWQDNRGAAYTEALRSHETLIFQKTGLRLTPYFLAPKLRLLLEQHPEWSAGLEQGALLMGTLDSFLIWHWSGKTVFQTDASMAARTLLMDVHTRDWSPDLCGLFAVPHHGLAQIMPSCGLHLPLANGCVLNASVADQSAAFLANVGSDQSTALVNLGTGGFVLCYANKAGHGYLNTLVYQDERLDCHFAAEGTVNSIAAALAPYPFQVCRVEQFAEIKHLFCSAEPSGIGAPYFRAQSGLVFSDSIQHLKPEQTACLVLEGIIFRVSRILEDFESLHGIKQIYLSGGLSDLSVLQQGIAACSGLSVFHLPEKEASLLGAGLLAAQALNTNQRPVFAVEVKFDALALRHKFREWREWFDGQCRKSK